MTVKLLPQEAADEPKPEPGDARKNARRSDDAEEIPETADERPTLELRREQSPRKRRRADESGEEPDVCGEILDRRTPQVIELGNDRCSREKGCCLNVRRKGSKCAVKPMRLGGVCGTALAL